MKYDVLIRNDVNEGTVKTKSLYMIYAASLGFILELKEHDTKNFPINRIDGVWTHKYFDARFAHNILSYHAQVMVNAYSKIYATENGIEQYLFCGDERIGGLDKFVIEAINTEEFLHVIERIIFDDYS
jgi:hypothetical protein